MPFVQKSVFLDGFRNILFFLDNPFCTFGQDVATLDCLFRSSYPQLHGIVTFIQILQGGLKYVLLSWRTFPLTYLHPPIHLCHPLEWFEKNEEKKLKAVQNAKMLKWPKCKNIKMVKTLKCENGQNTKM